MALIRGHHDFDDHFTQIPNSYLRDSRLSLEARGLYAQLLSHTEGWRISLQSLAHVNGIGRDKVRRIINELMAHGYLERSEEQVHNEKGFLAGYDYTTTDPTGVAWEPTKVEPTKVQPTKANKAHKKTKPKEDQLTRKTEVKNYSPDELQVHFNDFWQAYPLKRGKGAAAKAYEKALDKVQPDHLLDRVRSFRDDPHRPHDFTPLATTWLNQERWEDEPYKKRDKDKTNSERNVENFRASMQLLRGEQKEVESSGQSTSESAIDFGVNFRSAEDI